MSTHYRMQRLFRDGHTKIVIPDLSIATTAAVTNIVSSYVTNPTKKPSDQRFFQADSANNRDRLGNPFDYKDEGLMSMLSSIIDLLIIGFGVTKLETQQEYVMPFSKGIGSTGEVIHLLGAKNELISLTFKTDKYPGRLGYVLRAVLQKVLETAQVIYLVDDLFLATPCLVKKIKLTKEGIYRGAVMGELELVSLSTGGGFITDKFGTPNKISNIATKLRKSTKAKAFIGAAALITVGAVAVLSGTMNDIINAPTSTIFGES